MYYLCWIAKHVQPTIGLNIMLWRQAEKSVLLYDPSTETLCHLLSHSDRYSYRVQLGKHSLKASEEGSVARMAATIVTHEDYNIMLSR